MSKAFEAAFSRWIRLEIFYIRALLQLTIGDYAIEISLSGEYLSFFLRLSLPATGST